MDGVAVRPGHPVVLGVVGRTPVLGAPGYPVSAALTFDIFAVPLLAELSGAPPWQRPRAQARLARKLASPLGMDDWVRVRLGMVGAATHLELDQRVALKFMLPTTHESPDTPARWFHPFAPWEPG